MNMAEIFNSLNELKNKKHDAILLKLQEIKQVSGVFFLKPEACNLEDEHLLNIFEYIKNKVNEHKMKIKCIYILTGNFIKEMDIMKKLYKEIYNFSSLKECFMEEITNHVDNKEFEAVSSKIVGGMELVRKGLPARYLMDLWSQGTPALMLGQNIYGVPAVIDNTRYLIINGFFPFQLEQYQSRDSKILVFVFHSPTDLAKLKLSFQGSFDRNQGMRGSIRDFLYQYAEDKLLERFSPSMNGIHLSGTEVEGMQEFSIFYDAFNKYAGLKKDCYYG